MGVMALRGVKPKEDRSQVRHRHVVAGWTEVDNVPFEGGPLLPPRRDEPTEADKIIIAVRNGVGDVDISWPSQTERWWNIIRRMPHASLWTDADWEFAVSTAEVHARFSEGWKGYTGAELRQREKLMGVYADARRDLRIRYIEPKDRPAETADAANVIQMNEYRDL